MKKTLLALLSGLTLVMACNKQDAAVTVDEAAVTEPQVTGRYCASDELLQEQLASDPLRRFRLEELEARTQTYKGRDLEANGRFAGTLYIPVVVHIVSTNPAQVTDAQIQSQIDVLNKDFSKTNAEISRPNLYLAGYNINSVANCQVEFVLKQTIRKTTTVASFGTNDAIKRSSSGGSDAVNATTHLNLWVGDLGNGLLGYAQFPGGSSATDGVVVDYQAFGNTASYPLYASFNLGRTATHEVGHWLNLRHIWGDARCGNDLVTDTPPQDASNGGCPAQGLQSKCSGKPLEQWMNYMDYTNDACMYMFSSGQKVRMDAAIDASRAAYVLQTRP